METTWWPRGGGGRGLMRASGMSALATSPPLPQMRLPPPRPAKVKWKAGKKWPEGGKAAYFPLWESGQEGRSGPTTPRSTRREIEISAGQDYQFGPRAYRTGSICLRPTIPRRSCKCSAPWSTLSKFRRPVKQGSMSSHSPDGPRQDMDRSRQVMSRGS